MERRATSFRSWGLALFVALAMSIGIGPAEAAPTRKAAKAAANAASRALKARWREVLRLDRLAHVRARVATLSKPKTVFRYVSSPRARDAARRGIAKGTHFTARSVHGRPLSGRHAQLRFGLNRIPTRRLTVRLPAGTRVRTTKVHGGAPGVGEVLTGDRVPRTAIVRVTGLRSNGR